MTQLTSKTNAKAAKNDGEKGFLSQDSVEDALERSIHELILLAKFYQKHGYLRQAQEIYYYILTLQERRDKRKRSLKNLKTGKTGGGTLQTGASPNAGAEFPSRNSELRRTGLASAYGMCALKRS
jgi:hypothetical protein